MIQIMNNTPDRLLLSEIIPFQGDLKKRTKKQIDELAASILTEGLLMPFAVWVNDKGENILLDGHGRLVALNKLAESDPNILLQEYPVVCITADTEEQARKSLLQITSSYGNITRQGVAKFCATIPEYKAPSISKFTHVPKKRVKLEERPNETILRIAVATNKLEEVMQIFNDVEFIKVL